MTTEACPTCSFEEAVAALKEGQLVAIPTETVYGLAANGLDEQAVAKIFEAKERPSFDPLILHFSEISALQACVAFIPDVAHQLFEAFWPGPLTLILRKTPRVPDLVTAGMDKVAVRMPSHPIARKLLQALPFPLAAPSANLFGRTSPTHPDHVKEQLSGRIYGVLDGGSCAVGVESTILDLTSSEAEILRWGGIPQEALENFLGHPLKARTSSSRPSAPGMLEAHYSPGSPLKLLPIGQFPVDIHENDAWLGFSTPLEELPEEQQLLLSPRGDLHEAATRLFLSLRQLGQLQPRVIWAQEVPNEGLGRAINDRLRRASAS